MQQWEELMKATNEAYQKRCYYTALELCQRALHLAVNRFEKRHSDDHDRMLAAIMVSHFNLVDTYIALDQVDRAVDVFEDASIYLKELLCSEGHSDLLKAAAMRAGSSLHIEWQRFCQNNKSELPGALPLTAAMGLQLH